MEVPDWLMKPTVNNRQHIKVLSMIEHVQKASERRGIDPFLKNQIEKLNDTFWQHAKETVDLEENEKLKNITEKVKDNKIKTAIIGGLISIGFLIPAYLIKNTNTFMPVGIECKAFETQDIRYPGWLEICINGVKDPFTPNRQQVHLSYYSNWKSQTTLSEAVFDLNDPGDYQTERVRIYEDGNLVKDDMMKVSSHINPVVPSDVKMPLWNWVNERKLFFVTNKLSLEEKINSFVALVSPFLFTAGSVSVTAFRFFKS